MIVDDIEEAIEDIQNGLASWLMYHTLDGWLENDDMYSIWEYGVASEPADGKNVRETTIRHYAMIMAEKYPSWHCENCGDYYDVEEDYNKCPNCGRFMMRQPWEWLEDLYYDLDPNNCYAGEFAKALENALREIYEEYSEVYDLDYFIDAFESALDDLHGAKSAEELLAAFVFAISLNHVSGSIADYCSVIDRNLINEISQNGLEHVFGKEEIEEFMESF